MRVGKAVFIDSGAWIALALTRDPLHGQAVDAWNQVIGAGIRLYTSVPVVLETFTFLDRNTSREVALTWRGSLDNTRHLKTLDCTASDVRDAWAYFERRDLHKLSAVDATSFVLMKRHGIETAFAFDHHFASAGFQLL
ncbi:MAG: PIN domain-containing protein [Gammaproteobacteria bacterium]|nr:PIN domain-containing protein [Gammaproteobacteria bacterium]